MTIVDDEKIVENSEMNQIPKTEQKLDSSDITKVLKSADYWTAEYPNGLVLGIRPAGIPGTRGVYIDVVHILDLRRAKFGRSNLAVQAAILESVNRPLEDLFTDVDMNDLLGLKKLQSPLGRLEFKVLRSFNSGSASHIHETRTIFAVFKEGSSYRNLSWLTDTSRVVPDNELALLLSSDSRSHLHLVQKSVDPDKWDDLRGGYKKAWFALLPILLGVFSGFGILGSLTVGGNLLLPSIVCVISVGLALWMFKDARNAMNSFQDSLNSEINGLAMIGDAPRIKSAISENTTFLEIVGTLNFILTPLMDCAAVAMECGDIDTSVASLSSILDECVRIAPLSSDGELKLSGDPGFEKFIGLFKNLGLEFLDGEEEALGLAYVAITGHTSSPIKEHELMVHLGTLNNLLFDVGALSPEVKNRIDDLLNLRAGDKMIEEFDKELAKPDEFEVAASHENELSDEERALHEEMAKTYPLERKIECDSLTNLEVEISEDTIPEPQTDEIHPILIAETVPDEQKDIVQTTFGSEVVLQTGEEVVELAKKKQRSQKELAKLRSSKREKERGVSEV